MQSVIRLNKNAHPILDDIDRAYALTSTKAKDQDGTLFNPIFDNSFQRLFEVFSQFGDEDYKVSYSDVYENTDNTYGNPKNLILAFSGGKDSIAAALLYKEQGYNVYLYHLKHINASLSDEYICAEKCAELLGMPIFIDDVKFKGKHIWTEHPMKNMLIANGALSYGIRENIGTTIAFGNYTTSILEDNVFDRCAGDCMDMWECYNAVVQKFIKDFKVLSTLQSMTHTLDIVSKPEYRELFNNSISCLCRHSLRPYRHQWVKDKFNVDLPTYRCGSCYKCCVEYVYMTDHDLIDYNEDYYKYCLNQLYKVYLFEYGYIYSLAALWESYLFYSPEKSKLYDKFDNAIFLLGGIKWV